MRSVLLLLLVLRSASAAASHPTFVAVIDGTPVLAKSDTARCYSCMSKLYEGVWPFIRHVYMLPQNFTDDCDDTRISNSGVSVVNCPTICVSLFEQLNIAGVKIAGHIRGCMSDILVNGFNRTIVERYRWLHRDSCRPYRKRELFKLPGYDETTIDVCTCYDHYCNGNTGSKIAVSLIFMWLMLFQS